jgi:hypothetical protein
MYCISMHLGCETSMHYFSCLGGTGLDSIISTPNTLHQNCVFASGGIGGKLSWARCGFHKNTLETLCRTCVFASGGICGSRSVFLSSGA